MSNEAKTTPYLDTTVDGTDDEGRIIVALVIDNSVRALVAWSKEGSREATVDYLDTIAETIECEAQMAHPAEVSTVLEGLTDDLDSDAWFTVPHNMRARLGLSVEQCRELTKGSRYARMQALNNELLAMSVEHYAQWLTRAIEMNQTKAAHYAARVAELTEDLDAATEEG